MPGNRQFSGCCGSSSNSRGGSQAKVKCNCGRDAILRTVKHGPNAGMKFHGCPLWPDTCCDFFKWNCVENAEDLRFTVFEKETTIAEMEYEKGLLDEKIKKLQLKKENAEEELQDLKFELCQVRIELIKSARNERNFSMALLLSWLFFAMLVLYLK